MPFCHQDASFISKRRSDSGDYDFGRNAQNMVKVDIMDNIVKNEKSSKLLYNLMGGSLQRGKKQHRRVRSISDIDVNHIKPL